MKYGKILNKYNVSHVYLKKFYFVCENIRYIFFSCPLHSPLTALNPLRFTNAYNFLISGQKVFLIG